MLTKVEIIKEKLLDDIHSGRLVKDDAIPSRHQFMKRYNCARGTIDLAISELTEQGFLYSRQGAGTFVSAGPESIPLQQVIVIGNTCEFQEDDFSRSNSLGLTEQIQGQLPCFLYSSNDINVNIAKIAKRGSVVIWNTPSYEQLKTMKYLQKVDIPQVLLARCYSNLNYITTDAKPGIYEGLKWLIDAAGTREVAFVSMPINSDNPYQAERQIAFYESAVQLGIELRSENIFVEQMANPSQDINRVAAHIFKSEQCPKAIFLTEIYAALQFLAYASACNKEPGRDFHLLVFDSRTELETYHGVASLKQRWDLMRLEAVKWVGRMQSGKDTAVNLKIKPELIIGQG